MATRCPEECAQTSSLSSVPARMSSARSNPSRVAVGRKNGSSSTYRRMILASGTSTMVCPSLAKP